MHHDNNGKCEACAAIFDKYPGFNKDLRIWFEMFQKDRNECHVSCAGRGREDQELAFAHRMSRARWTQSAHNWNCAIDIFVIIPGNNNIYPLPWFHNVLAPALPDWIRWYGRPKCPFPELPHCEIDGWKSLIATGEIELVE